MVDYYGGGLPYQIHIDIVLADGSVLDVSDMLTSRDDLHIAWNYDGQSPHEARFRLSAAQGAGLSDVHEELEVRIYDDFDPANPYPRLFNGYIKGFDPDDEGPNERFVDIFCQSKFLLLTESAAHPGDTGHANPYIVGPQYPYWAATTAYVINSYIQPTLAHANGYYYKATTAGTSGGSEPTWPTTPGATVSDGSVVWTNQGAFTEYLYDDLAINALIAEYEPTLSTSGVNRVVGMIQRHDLEDVTLLDALGTIGADAGINTYSSWASLHAYNVGDTIQPTSINGRYYTCTTAGTSGSVEPTWPTELGTYELDHVGGALMWQMTGYTQILPFPYVTITPDNAGHTANWAPILNWIDENSLGTHTIEFSDAVTETSTKKHYELSARRRDSKGFANKQTVTGAIGYNARSTYTDTAGVAYIGRTISAPTVNKTDIKTDAQCATVAQRVLRGSKRVHETISVTLPLGGTDLEALLTAPKKIKFTKQLEGISGTLFACPRFTLDFKNGVPQWGMELGQTFRRLNADDIPAFLGGVEYAGDTAAPQTPTWAPSNGWIIENSYDPTTQTSTVEVQWSHGAEATLNGFYVDWYFTNGTHHYPFVAWSGVGTTQNYRLEGITPGAQWNIRVRAVKVNGRSSDWSLTETLTTSISPTQGVFNGSFEVVSPNDPTQALGWDNSGCTGTSTTVRTSSQQHTGAYSAKLNSPNNSSTASYLSAPFAINAQQWAYATAWVWCSPAGASIRGQLHWYDATNTLLRSDVVWNNLYGPGYWAPTGGTTHAVLPPANAVTGRFQIQAVYVSANLNMYVDDVTVMQRRGPVGGGGGGGTEDPPPGSGPGAVYPDPPEAVQADASTAYDLDTINTYRGQASHSLTVPNVSNAVLKYQGMPQAATAGEVWSAWTAVKAGVATGTAKLLLRWFDGSDALISESTIYTGTPTTGFVEQQGQATAPANTRYVRWAIYYQQAGIPVGVRTAYFAPPRAFRAVGDNDVNVLTNATKARYDIQTNPLSLYDAAGNYRGQLIYDNVNDRVRFTAANPTSSTGMRVDAGSSAKGFTIAPSGAITTDQSVAIGTTSTPITGYLSGSASVSFGAINQAATGKLTVTLTGAAVGQKVIATPANGLEAGLVWSAFVSAADTISLVLANLSGGTMTPATRTWYFAVIAS